MRDDVMPGIVTVLTECENEALRVAGLVSAMRSSLLAVHHTFDQVERAFGVVEDWQKRAVKMADEASTHERQYYADAAARACEIAARAEFDATVAAHMNRVVIALLVSGWSPAVAAPLKEAASRAIVSVFADGRWTAGEEASDG